MDATLRRFSLITLAAACLVAATTANATWPSAPDQTLQVLATPDWDQILDAVADGQGGMWVSTVSSGTYLLSPHVQHISAKGELLLGPDGVQLTNASGNAAFLLPAADGGVFVAWVDFRESRHPDIYMQKLSAAGALEWPDGGVLIESGPNLAFAVGAFGTTLRSIDGGESWSEVPSGPMQNLHGVIAFGEDVLAVGDGDTQLLSKDLGLSWSVIQSGIGPTLRAVDLPTFYRGIAVGDGGRSWEWDGNNWTLHTHPVTVDFHGVSIPSYSAPAFAVGKNGRIARSDDTGASWVEQDSGVGVHLNDVCFSSNDVGTAVGNLGVILRTTDGGVNWVLQSSGTPENLLSVDFRGDSYGIATGENDAVVYTRDGGSSWSAGVTPTNVDLAGVDMTDADTAIAVGENGTILKTSDGGATWTQKPGAPSGSDLLAVSAPGNGTAQYYPRLVDDGAGGVVVVWWGQDLGAEELFAQRVDASGAKLWSSPTQITDLDEDTFSVSFRVMPRGGGGAIVTWFEDLSGTDDIVYAQALDLDGEPVQAQPSIVTDYPSPKLVFDAAPDGSGGCLLAWSEERVANYELFAMRLDSDANPLWTEYGELVSADGAASNQWDPQIVADGVGGGYFVWSENRDPSSDYDLFAQRLDGSGNTRWAQDLVITDAPGEQRYPRVAQDGLGGFVLSWDEEGPDRAKRAQAVAPDGVLRWPHEPALREGAEIDDGVMITVSDGQGGLLAVWDQRDLGTSDQNDVHAQNMDRHGYKGLAAAAISAVEDVPQDQGGEVSVIWSPSYLDAFPQQVVTHYSVWRSNPGATKRASAEAELVREAALRAGIDPTLFAAQASTGWSYVGTTPAAYLSSYAHEAPTYGDQTQTENLVTDFQVIAHTENAFVFWYSEQMAGSSVDNLSPPQPASLLAAESDGAIELFWSDGPGAVEDLDHYRIYRGATPDFAVESSSLLATSVDRHASDPVPGMPPIYYRVSAVDVHDNESIPSDVAAVGAVTDVGSEVASRFLLRPAYPNPTSGASVLSFSLPKPGPAHVEVFDLAGRRVLHEELRASAGWQRWTFRGLDHRGRALASGVYMVRLRHEGHSQAAKIVLSR